MTTENAFNLIMQSELFRLNGPKIDLPAALIDLAHAIKAEAETDWSLGEFLECSLDSLIVGAYWSLTEWHGGQSSPEPARFRIKSRKPAPPSLSPVTNFDPSLTRMKTAPLDFIDLLEPATGRQSGLSIYGKRKEHADKIGITGGLSHGSLVVPASVHDADKLIAWLQDWKGSQV
jgi:hypothetical protein